MGRKPEESEDGIIVQEGRSKPKEPPSFAVLLHNDDYTTMEFVVEVLRRFFKLTEEGAVRIMLEVHQIGKGVAGVYHFEVAETKVAQVNEFAHSKGFPLKCTMEPDA